MRFIKGLAQDTLKLLERIHKQSKHHQVRQRAQCIKLSYQGYQINDLMKIFNVSRLTITNWFNDWDEFSLIGLYDRKGRGRKSKLNDEQKEQVKKWAKENSRNLNIVVKNAREEWGIYISKNLIRRILNLFKVSWHRIKRGVAGQPDPIEYKEKKEELENLKRQEDAGKIDLFFCDETGFCLIPYVPYAWQEEGEEIIVKTQRSKRLNVLGFLNRKNELETYIFECNINSDIVIACIDKFCERIVKPTVLIVDNASIHTSSFVFEKQEEWRQKGLTLFFLPTYSPELNIIEILWRFIKYYWLDFDAYNSWQNLVESVEYILRNFGEEYIINFS
ncbi:IS630 family transposase [Brunnivagina elsteri]|jgi:transposase|uniref:IS630 family transposase n=1 Tax=Brunnivagina elsteri CCALA 953 TaxID=987040 RepID=A0A2A2TNI6_9CYAN|nr:IS630 family transposase [Calothrix elsteri]PAX60071.1 IS630 family transposase [Calothrix elsteri CCALA 953]